MTDTNNTVAAVPQEEIVPRLHAEMERLEAAALPDDKRRVRVSYNVDRNSYWHFYASIGDAFGCGHTPEDAVDECIKKYGTAETRRANEIATIKASAAKLGFELVEAEVAA